MPSYFLSRTLRHKYEDRPGRYPIKTACPGIEPMFFHCRASEAPADKPGDHGRKKERLRYSNLSCFRHGWLFRSSEQGEVSNGVFSVVECLPVISYYNGDSYNPYDNPSSVYHHFVLIQHSTPAPLFALKSYGHTTRFVPIAPCGFHAHKLFLRPAQGSDPPR